MKRSQTLLGILALCALLLVLDSTAFGQRGARSSAGRSSGHSAQRSRAPSRASRPAARAPQRSRASSPTRRSTPSRAQRSAPTRRSTPSRAQRSAPTRRSTPSRAQRSTPTRRSTPSRAQRSTPTRRSTPSRAKPSTPTRSSGRATSPRSSGSRTFTAPTKPRGSSRAATPTRTPRTGRNFDAGRTNSPRGNSVTGRTSNTTPTASRDTSARDRANYSGRATATTGSPVRTPENTGRSRFDRYTNRDKGTGTTRFARVDSDRNSPVIDLSGAADPRRTRTVIPRLRGSQTKTPRRIGSDRFEPSSPARTTAAGRVRTSRIRTKPITRDSVIKRYNRPTKTAARGSKQATPTQPGRGQRLRGANADRTKGQAARNPKGPTRQAVPAKEQRARNDRKFGKLAKQNPKLAGQLDRNALGTAAASNLVLETGINAGLAFSGVSVGVSFYDDDFAVTGSYYSGSSYSSWGSGYPCYYGGYPQYGYGYGYGNCYSNYYPYRSRYCYGFPYYYSSIFGGYYGGYSNAYYDDDDDEYEDGFEEGFDRGFDSGAAVGGAGESVQVGEGVIQAGGLQQAQVTTGTRMIPSTPEIGKEALSRAAAHYLTVGDGAFLDKRYGDAVHFYAKAIEFAPDEGVLYLILSDALFATGDYHYAAYALRKALELDPELTASIDDKHSFYKEPAEFDRQVAVLESFLEDHYVDDDARLLLAANYLFGNRPAAAVDLLESSFSKAVRESDSGQLLLAAAKSIQYGTPSTD